MWKQISDRISLAIGENFAARSPRSVSGGCINEGYKVTDGRLEFFVKINRADRVSMFEAEAAGLEQMAATQTIRVPKPICWGVASDASYIVLEWLNLGQGNTKAQRKMGRQLAKLHQYSGSTAFGWTQSNTIGSTPQINYWKSDWIKFWQEHRIGYQLELAHRQGGNFPQANAIMAAIPQLLTHHEPQPSFVHGDLWGGNAAVTDEGEPVIFDPAAYWGDREVDLAMTELFGGFSSAFYAGYNEVAPVDAGYERRKILYNLYHILNHYNLFGSGYAGQANRMIEQLLQF
ncbi:fructosamine kinase family protein [filamentous cyanobacterium LEGE 11480]|uniref:Fructosamine kinase family protein n=1 Tax=Romeriopsis navalis LEGE 11480 TaxID=2777977 RepID=A0A928VS63_9CYAN|nr:fructosamine kinase family protein [Romeriopsis navalis]MBE9031119.1 fructosamine kinase family protein [Romeriopsis navalis LEGE 11480]